MSETENSAREPIKCLKQTGQRWKSCSNWCWSLFKAYSLIIISLAGFGEFAQAVASEGTPWPQVERHIASDTALLSGDGLRTLVPAGRYDEILPAGRVAIVSRKLAWGLIDADGRPLTALRYKEIEPFGPPKAPQGFVVVNEQGQHGVLDATGRIVTDPVWSRLQPIMLTAQASSEGSWFFAVQQAHRMGVLSANGRAVLPVQFTDVSWLGARTPLVIVTQGEMQGVCNVQTGECPQPLSSQQYKPFDDGSRGFGLIHVSGMGRVGLLDAKLREVLPPKYEAIETLRGLGDNALHVQARQGLGWTQLILKADESERWSASQSSTPIPVPARRDDHALALRQRAVIDARYVPQAMSDAASVAQAFANQVLRELRQPSIQLSGSLAYVGFDLYVSVESNTSRPLPDVWSRCVAPSGIRLIAWNGPSRDFAKACSAPGFPTIHLELTPDANNWRCSGCEALGLPTNWIRQDAPPVDAQCKSERASWATDAAQRDYTRWLNDWLPIWQPALQKSTPDKTASKDWFGHHASPSRALWTLTAIMYRPESVLVDVGIDETTKRHFDLGAALIKWVKKAVPVGFGGLYPEPEVEFASQCAQVWYLRWPELDKKMLRYTRVAGKPFDHGWGLPPAGTLLRQTYPFLTFSRDEDGQLKLAGISREFLHALWLLEGGQ